jgi:hypothetical protein
VPFLPLPSPFFSSFSFYILLLSLLKKEQLPTRPFLNLSPSNKLSWQRMCEHKQASERCEEALDMDRDMDKDILACFHYLLLRIKMYRCRYGRV